MKTKLLTAIIALLCVAASGTTYLAYNAYSSYQRGSSLKNKDVIERSDYSKIDDSQYDTLSDLELSSFSASSDGTFVKAYGSITNNTSNYIDEIFSIAFFNENGEVIRVKAIHVKLSAKDTMYFEEFIGLIKEGTSVPKSAKLTN
ncbi:hypothetical protein A0U40_02815 [[Bacillus] sp. KCTC 13219]|nr:hypothetical protein A0U40_02815 [[Bacillus] sp. KCTC 13219]